MDAEPVRFGAGDYAVFAVMLAMSLAIGIFYAIRDRRSKEVQDYLMGGRKMSFWSVGISLSYTFASAVTILGIPAEIYVFGAMYFWLIPCCLLVAPVVTEIYIPLYCRLNLTSCYEYLQLRFNYAVRLIGTAAYIAQTILYLGVMIYAPSLALSQVSGFNIWAAIFSTGIVCTLYTTLGGLKAVVWSDVFQGIMVIIVLMVSMFMSAAEIGGWDAVWAANHRGNRLDFFVWVVTFAVSRLYMSLTKVPGMVISNTKPRLDHILERHCCVTPSTMIKQVGNKMFYFSCIRYGIAWRERAFTRYGLLRLET